MGKPQIEIEVDDKTGRWRVDAMPMILVPQHFFLNNHFAVEAELGPERLAALLRPAGHRSAYVWCEKEAAHHRLSGIEVFRHYMRRLSQRGWGQFEVSAVAQDGGTAEVRVRNSVFVDQDRNRGGAKVCYMFAAWLEGSLEYVGASSGKSLKLVAREVCCAAEGHAFCTFKVEPAAGA
jgi:Domain of unknown function (DUF5943)/V4R domain